MLLKAAFNDQLDQKFTIQIKESYIYIIFGIICALVIILYLIFKFRNINNNPDFIVSITILFKLGLILLLIILAIITSTDTDKILPVLFIINNIYFYSILSNIVLLFIDVFIIQQLFLQDIMVHVLDISIETIIYFLLIPFIIDKNIIHIKSASSNNNAALAQVLQDYLDNGTITPTYSINDFNYNNIDILKNKYITNILNPYINNLTICQQNLQLRQQQKADASTNIVNLSSNISNLLTTFNNLYQTTNNKYNDANTTLQNILNAKNNLNTQFSAINTSYNNYITNYITSQKVANLSNNFILNNLNNIQTKLQLLLQMGFNNTLTYMHRGQDFMLPNSYYLYTYGLTVRNKTNSNFSQVQINSHDKLYLLDSTMPNITLTSSNIIDMFNDDNMQIDNYKLIYDNNNLINASIATIQWNNIKYGINNNITSITTPNYSISYNNLNNQLIVSYNPSNNIYVFSQNDMFIYPDKYINYNLNTKESYAYDSNSNYLYLQSTDMKHEFNEKLWNLYGEDNQNTRIIHSQLINTNSGIMSFITKQNQSINMNIPAIVNGHVLYIEDSNRKYIFIFTATNTYMYWIDTQNIITDVNNYAPMFNTGNTANMGSTFMSSFAFNNRTTLINKMNNTTENIYGNFVGNCFNSNTIDTLTI